MHVFIDDAYDVDTDGKGHSGLFVTIGTGAMINASKKLGLCTVSSAEIEVVSTGEIFPRCTWFIHFRVAQGEDDSKEDILLQDNQNCILLYKSIDSLTERVPNTCTLDISLS